MTDSVVPVVIVGAGPTGVTAATLLAQHGVRCVVLERFDHAYPMPRAVHVDDEVVRILARLGIAEDFARISRPAQGLRLLASDMRVLAQFQRGGEPGAHGFHRANMFHQPALEALLRTNLRRHLAATLRCGVEVVAVAQDNGTPVRLELLDRTTGRAELLLAEYVLGCDGANSRVRAAIGSAMESLGFEQRWLVVDIASAVDLGLWDGVHQVCDPRRAATCMRVDQRRYRWEFRLHPGESERDYPDLESLRPLLEPWLDPASQAELELVRVAEYTFRAQIAEHWRAGRVFLLGDAAHLTPPFIGQGLCAGLRDAMNLSWKLAAVLDGSLPPAVLDSYQAERKPHARSLIRLAVAMGRAMTAGGEVGDMVRRTVLPRLRLVPGARAKLLDSATPRLRRSALVHGSRLDRLAGRLCPNALVDGGRRFDEVVCGRRALVTAVPLAAAERADLERRGLVVVDAQPRSQLHAWLRRGRARAALVRPDGTVLRSARSPRGLDAGLRATFVAI